MSLLNRTGQSRSNSAGGEYADGNVCDEMRCNRWQQTPGPGTSACKDQADNEGGREPSAALVEVRDREINC
jgi:hypothetical protein